jgi:signal peptidase II
MQPIVKRLLIMLAIILVSIALDQFTKQLAIEHLQGMSMSKKYLGDTFRLTFVENTGAFLSLGANQSGVVRTIFLKVFPVLMLGGLFFYTLLSKSMGWWHVIAFSFILGGGFSNIYDRLLYGKVVDFMNMGIGSLRTGIFNVADMSIMLGLFILLPMAFKKEPKKEEPVTTEHNSESETA